MGNYIVAADVNNWPDSYIEADKQNAIEEVENRIEYICKNVFYEKDFDIYLDGNDANRINLGLQNDLLHISSFQIIGTELPSDWYTWDKVFAYLDVEQATSDPDQKLLLETYGAMGIFPRGIKNLHVIGTTGAPKKLPIDTIVGTFSKKEIITGGTSGATAYVYDVFSNYLLIVGISSTNFSNDETLTGGTSGATALVNSTIGAFDNVPYGIKKACIMMVQYDNDPTLYSGYGSFKSERLGDYSYDKGDSKDLLSGISEVDIKLKPFIRKKARIFAV